MPTDPTTIDGIIAVSAPQGATPPGMAQASSPATAPAASPNPATGRDRASLVRRVLTWLRGGYPHGVPREDYVALFGVLHRELTDTEIAQVVGQLTAEGDVSTPITTDQVREVIARTVLERPSDQDIARVNEHLAAGGWALAEEDEHGA